MNAFRTVGARLSLALLGVVALVLGLVYLIVVPSLKSRLIDNRLNDLAHARRALVAEYKTNAPDFYSNAAASTNARVVLMSVFSQSPSTVVTPGNSSLPGRRVRAFTDEPVADRSADELGELSRAFDRMRIRLAGLDHARREFVANASHELRTPLFSLGGFLELMEDEELDEATRREFLDTMAGQVRRLTKLADDLLDLSRLDAGRLQVETQPVDLGELAGAAVQEFAGVALASEHPLEYAANGGA